jgi:hypothetical protein
MICDLVSVMMDSNEIENSERDNETSQTIKYAGLKHTTSIIVKNLKGKYIAFKEDRSLDGVHNILYRISNVPSSSRSNN